MMERVLKNIDLNLLLVFRTLLETGHLSRAAEKLHLSQPAMSHALARLRTTFGDRLFVKGPRGMQPTAKAITYAKGIASALETLEATFSGNDVFDARLSTAVVRLATTDYTEELLWPRLCTRLCNEAPKMRLESVGLRARIPLAELEEGVIDMAVGNFPKPPTSLRTIALFNDEFVSIARKGFVPAGKKVSLKQFVETPHLLVAPWGVARGNVDEALEKHGFERQIAVTVGHFASAPGIIENSDLIATLPRRLAQRWKVRYDLCFFEPPVAIPPVKINVLWHERTHEYPPAQLIRSWLVECSRD